MPLGALGFKNNPATEVANPLRTPSTCPLRCNDLQLNRTQCRLLIDLFVDYPQVDSIVSQDICDSCCRSFLPNAQDWNQVVASVIWSRTVDALNANSSHPSTEQHAKLQEIKDFAEACFPIVTEFEDDIPDQPPNAAISERETVEALAAVIPPGDSPGKSITHWAVGVTTAPRRIPTLEMCLSSLCDVGWESVHVFVDGDVELPEQVSQQHQTIRRPAAGAWRNFYLAIVELLSRYPEADAIMMVQDDAYWPKGFPVREYLEQLHWPNDQRFLVSPYCCADYATDQNGWNKFSGTWQYGAVALVFSRTSAEAFVADSMVMSRCKSSQSGGIDTIVGLWAEQNQISIYFPTPSLVQHVGDVSTLWRTSRAVGLRRAVKFLGDFKTPSRGA